MARSPSEMFRKEAIEALQGGNEDGHLLHIVPIWSRLGYWVLLLAVIGAVVYGSFAKVHEFATGPSVVRVEGRTNVPTPTGGTVTSIEARLGQHVSAGQVLVRFYSENERVELSTIRQDFQAQISKYLRDMNDEGSRQAVSALRTRLESAERMVRNRAVVAPQDGIISDVRVHPGQMLGPGDIVLSIDGDKTSYSIITVLPGQFRPMLKKGMPLRLSLDGFPHVYHTVPIESVSNMVYGPNETRKLLGPDVGDAVPIPPSAVMVTGRLRTRDFAFEGKVFSYYGGISGHADVAVRTQRAIVALFPVLKEIMGNETK